MATDEDVRRIVREELNSALALFYTGSRWLRIPPDDRVFELVMVDGCRYKAHAEDGNEVGALQWADAVAGSPGDAPRDVTNPAHVAYFESLPWLSRD